MFDWLKILKRFWPAIILSLALLLILDGTISSLETCHPPNSTSGGQNSDKDCTVFQGPLASLIFVLGDFFEANDKGIVAAFTVILAISTIGLWTATINLYKSGEKQIRSSRQIAAIQARQSHQQFRLARDEFASSHRPRIRVKHVWLVALGSDRPVTVEIVYANVGDAKAIVSRIGMDFNLLNPNAPLPGNLTAPERPYIKYPECGLGVTVSTGNVTSLASLDEWRIAAIRDGAKLLCCFGFIEYSDAGPDETRKIRRTAFCRVYKPSANPIDGIGRFIRPEKPDPDYEYED
jgi:hypothetical protein